MSARHTEQYWPNDRIWQWEDAAPKGRLRRFLVLSFFLHALLFASLVFVPRSAPPEPVQLVYQMEMIQETLEEQPVEEPPPPPPEPPKPKPEPPKPKPEPEPPKPKPEPEKPKAEVSRPKPEPEKPKEEPPPPPKPKPEPPKPQQVAQALPPSRAAISVQQDLPPELLSWISRVQKKVSALWQVPPGIRLDAEETAARVSFWVDREGRLIDIPVVTRHASDPALGNSGAQALRLAEPLPRFPDEYPEMELRVEMTFTLER